jgi:hypothetical protein
MSGAVRSIRLLAIQKRKGRTMNEALEEVELDLGFASDGLREALRKASAVEALVLLPLIKRVNETRNDVAALIAARA